MPWRQRHFCISLTNFPKLDYGYACHYNRQIKKRGRAKRSDKQTDETATVDDEAAVSSHRPYQHQRTTSSDIASSPKSFRRTSFTTLKHNHVAGSQSYVPSETHSGDPYSLDSFNLQQHTSNHPLHQHAVSEDTNQMEEYPPSTDSPENEGRQTHRKHRMASAGSGSAFNFTLSTPKPLYEGPSSNPAGQGDPSTSWVSECRYRWLYPLSPYFSSVFPPSLACDLIDIFLVDPGTSLFRCASPYILTRIFRKSSLLHPTNPRETSPALLATILWCCAQTADISSLLVPGSRANLTNALYELATFLISRRDPDRWRRIHGESSWSGNLPRM